MSVRRSGSSGRKQAVALQYHDEMPAPLVVAKAGGGSAERLVEIARSHGITVVERDTVSDSLMFLDVGQYVPEQLYQVVAELLVFVRQIEGRNSQRRER